MRSAIDNPTTLPVWMRDTARVLTASSEVIDDNSG
jgi:hypothetical protein